MELIWKCSLSKEEFLEKDLGRCDRCFFSHKKCDRKVPQCMRCSKLDVECTRKRPNARKMQMKPEDSILLGKGLGSGRAMSNWKDVILKMFGFQKQSVFACRRVAPLAILFGSEQSVLEIVEKSNIDRQEPLETQKTYFIIKSPNERRNLCSIATSAFFHFSNPFLPLFSEEGFHSYPRSALLRAIVVHIGLSRLSNCEEVLSLSSQIRQHLCPTSLFNLPSTLDSLQCLILILFVLVDPSVVNARPHLYDKMLQLIPLLGINLNISHPKWVERRLAFYVSSLAMFFTNPIQDITTTAGAVLYHATQDLPMSLTFTHFEEQIHFIVCDCLFFEFKCVLQVAHAFNKSSNDINTSSLKTLIIKNYTLMQRMFAKIWLQLARMTSLVTGPLLHKSRMFLAIRHYNSCLRLIEFASYIIDGHTSISPKPITNRITTFSQIGLTSSVKLIQLIGHLVIAPFELRCARLIAPSCAYIVAHYNAIHSRNAKAILSESITTAILYLVKMMPYANVKAELNLLRFVARKNHVSFFDPSD